MIRGTAAAGTDAAAGTVLRRGCGGDGGHEDCGEGDAVKGTEVMLLGAVKGTEVVLLALAAAMLLPAAGRCAPRLVPLDAEAERVLVGPGVADPPQTHKRRGRWQVLSDRVQPQRRRAPAGWFWLAGGEATRIENGTVRARFSGRRRVEATVLLRAAAAGGELVRGYGLRICGNFVWLVEIRDGRARLIDHKVWLGSHARDSVEVLLHAMGPHLVAVVYDADDGGFLGKVSTHLDSGIAGRVGLMAGCSRGRRAARLTRLALRPACRRLPAAPPVGPPVAVWLPGDQPGPPGPGTEPLETWPQPTPVTAWRTDPFGLERAFCAGRQVLRSATDLPWKYLDLNLLRHLTAAAGAPTEAGPDAPPPPQGPFAHTYAPEHVGALLHRWQREHPERCRVERLATSHGGRPVWALAIAGPGPPAAERPALLLTGSHHGDEVLTTSMVLDAARRLLEGADQPRVRRWLAGLRLWFVPLVNPDGLHHFIHQSVRAGRKNGRDLDGDGQREVLEGVDLNRNYPFAWGTLDDSGRPISRRYRGPAPLSEPETRALAELARRERFAAAISYHLGTVAMVVPYTSPETREPIYDETTPLARALVAAAADHPQGGRLEVRPGIYLVDGAEQDWHRHAHGTVALLVEAAGWPPPSEPKERRAIVEALRPLWTGLLDRLLDGPGLRLTVRNADGGPAEVEVRIAEQRLRAGERWTTRPRDGRCTRLLPAPGSYHVEFHRDGERLLRRAVQVGQQMLELELTLPEE